MDNLQALRIFFIISILFLFTGCGTLKAPYFGDDALVWMEQQPTPGKKLVHTLFVLGDAGELDEVEKLTQQST